MNELEYVGGFFRELSIATLLLLLLLDKVSTLSLVYFREYVSVVLVYLIGAVASSLDLDLDLDFRF